MKKGNTTPRWGTMFPMLGFPRHCWRETLGFPPVSGREQKARGPGELRAFATTSMRDPLEAGRAFGAMHRQARRPVRALSFSLELDENKATFAAWPWTSGDYRTGNDRNAGSECRTSSKTRCRVQGRAV